MNKNTHTVKSWCYLYNAAIAGYKTHDFRDMTERDTEYGGGHWHENFLNACTYYGVHPQKFVDSFDNLRLHKLQFGEEEYE